MDTLKDARKLLAELVEREGGRPRFLEKTGISKQYLSNLLNGNSPFGPGSRNTIEEKLGLPPGWFASGGALPVNDRRLSALSRLPVLSWADAGLMRPPLENTATMTIPGTFSEAAFVLHMESDAMLSPSQNERSLPPGSFIVVEPAAQAAPGDFVVARVPGATSATVRKLIEDSGFRYLSALNPKFTELVKVTPDVQIVGRVMGTFANF